MKISAISGVVGCIVILVCVLLSIIMYTGTRCENYSMLNHFISELGDRRTSVGSTIFNSGMVVSSVFLTGFGIGFTTKFMGWQRVVVGSLCLLTGVSCAFVGILSVDILKPHLVAAMIFFHSALCLVFFATAHTYFAKKPFLPKWTVSLGIVTALCFATFVLWPRTVIAAWAARPTKFIRPEIWWHPIWEWACFFSIIAWLLVVSVIVLRSSDREKG